MTTRTTAPATPAPTPRIPAGNLRADGSVIDPTEPATAAALARDDAATTPAPAKRGWPDLGCLLCGSTGTVSLELADLDTFRCSKCGEEFDLGTVREQVRLWTEVLRWVELSPVREE